MYWYIIDRITIFVSFFREREGKLKFFKYGNRYTEYVNDDAILDYPEEVNKMLEIFYCKNRSNIKTEVAKKLKKEFVVSMCTIVDDIERNV